MIPGRFDEEKCPASPLMKLIVNDFDLRELATAALRERQKNGQKRRSLSLAHGRRFAIIPPYSAITITTERYQIV
jgi:hypothetical protein